MSSSSRSESDVHAKKRSLEDDIDEDNPSTYTDGVESHAKRSRTQETEMSKDDMDRLLAQADKNQVLTLDARSLKSMATSLQKAIRKNALQRSKYANDPTKFMDSEVTLDEEVNKWKAVGAASSLYPRLQELQVPSMLLGMLSHENLDVRLSVLSVLAELSDVVEEEASATSAVLEHTRGLVQTFVDQNMLSLVVSNMWQMDAANPTQDENAAEATGIYHSLQLLENVAEVLPSACEQAIGHTNVAPFLLQLVSPSRSFSENKLYASEILSILLQSGPASRDHFLKKQEDTDGLDGLLQALAPYRKRTPASEEEEELVENLVNSLCSVLLVRQAQDHFRHLEGMELMLRCLKDKKLFVGHGAVRIVDHATIGNVRNCERLVQVGGLRALFSYFMGKKIVRPSKNYKLASVKAQLEENTASIIASCCGLLRPEAEHDVCDRFHAKFIENEMEKVDRLVSLFGKYYERVQSSVDDDSDEAYVRRLEAGLYVLQRLAFTLAHLCTYSRKLNAYINIQLYESNLKRSSVVDTLKEQLELLEQELEVKDENEEKTTEDIERSRTQIRELLDGLEVKQEQVKEEEEEEKVKEEAE